MGVYWVNQGDDRLLSLLGIVEVPTYSFVVDKHVLIISYYYHSVLPLLDDFFPN